MAGITKMTTLRRMALIIPNYDIVWEGVDIEGQCVLRRVNTFKDGGGDQIISISADDVPKFAKKEGLEVKYQDPSDEGYWEPRES
jgi:hypothetical protein